MSNPPTGSDPADRDGAALSRLLIDVADDPDAPPSSVSALAVIAAARSGGRAEETAASPPTAGVGPAGVGRAEESAAVPPTAGVGPAGVGPTSAARAEAPPGDRPATPDQARVGELHVLSAQQDTQRRARRRRTVLLGGLAAACVVAVAAVVVPLTLSNSGGTTSSADRAAAASAAPAQTEAGGPAAAVPPTGTEAQGEQEATAQDQAGAGSATAIDPANPDANRPPPGADALTQTVPVPGGTAPTDTGSGAGGVATSCWPALTDAASAALVGSLPSGAFDAPGLLGLGCPAEPVAGASLAGTTPDTQLVVRVVQAEPGACARSASETGAKCVARGGDQYVSNDAGNLSVYAYGNGYEVEVGGRPATGIAPIPSGLTADQLAAAAAAVLGALG